MKELLHEKKYKIITTIFLWRCKLNELLKHKDINQAVMVKPLMDTAMAADYMGCSKSWLEKVRVTGIPKIKYIKLGKKVVYRLEDLNKFLTEHSRTSTSENPRITIKGNANR